MQGNGQHNHNRDNLRNYFVLYLESYHETIDVGINWINSLGERFRDLKLRNNREYEKSVKFIGIAVKDFDIKV